MDLKQGHGNRVIISSHRDSEVQRSPQWTTLREQIPSSLALCSLSTQSQLALNTRTTAGSHVSSLHIGKTAGSGRRARWQSARTGIGRSRRRQRTAVRRERRDARGAACWPPRRRLPASHFLCTLAREPAASAAAAARQLLNRYE